MRILVVSQWYPPEPDHVVSGLAETLRDLGHEVAVLTGYPNYPSGKIYPGYQQRLCYQETIRGVSVYRVPLYPDHGQSGIRRAFNYLSFATSAACIGPWLVPRPDVIHAYHPPLTIGCPAWVLSRRFRVPFTYEIQDMWPETLSSTGMVSNRFLLGMIGSMAKWVFRRAAAIRVISPGFRENLVRKGVGMEKIHVIPNWADLDLFHPETPDPEMARSLGLRDRFNVLYAGNVGPAQDLQTVLEAGKLSQDLPRLQWVVVGDGTELQRLQELARKWNLQNVSFLGRYPEKDMAKIYALADALLVHLRDDPLFRITVPHKILAYMACGKPVVGAVAGDAVEVIRAANAGLTCPPGNPSALAETVRKLYALSTGEREIMGENGRRFVCASFRREHLVAQVARMLEHAVMARRRARSRQ